MKSMIGKWVLARRPIGNAARLFLARRFSPGSGLRVCVFYTPSRIAFSQVYPFLFYEDELRSRFKSEIRLIPVDHFLDEESSHQWVADVYFIQLWFTVEPPLLTRVFDRLASQRPNARIYFLDAFAHNDLRLSPHIDPFIHRYLKKSLFRNREDFLLAFRGETNLTQYYGDLYGVEAPPVDWKIPRSILPKLGLWPNFFTGPQFLADFFQNKRSKYGDFQNRNIDVHARLGIKGSDWYQRMREASLSAISSIPGTKVVTDPGISWRKYMTELRDSKLCFSPFGYGELCWRDVEAFMAGSVLVKPDMGHLETHPDLFVPYETYVPIRWDFSDLEEKILHVLGDDQLRTHIAATAYNRIHHYVRQGEFVNDMNGLLS